MLHVLLIFLVTSAISFAGSVQLGPVNLAIMKTALEGRPRAALWMGAGICVPEFIYAAVALFTSAWLLRHETVLKFFEWGVVPLLLGLGLFNLFKKSAPKSDTDEPSERAADFMRGFVLSALNPQMLPFWLTILVMLNGYEFFMIGGWGDRIAFIIGTGAGEFVLILLVVWLTGKFRNYLVEKLSRWSFDRIFGWLFIGLAAVQSIKLLIRG
jgi:threonine/homoserine/homoserine lactone efflux protein